LNSPVTAILFFVRPQSLFLFPVNHQDPRIRPPCHQQRPPFTQPPLSSAAHPQPSHPFLWPFALTPFPSRGLVLRTVSGPVSCSVSPSTPFSPPCLVEPTPRHSPSLRPSSPALPHRDETRAPVELAYLLRFFS